MSTRGGKWDARHEPDTIRNGSDRYRTGPAQTTQDGLLNIGPKALPDPNPLRKAWHGMNPL